jgi:hypothetical protein
MTASAHRIRWFVYADGDREPRPHTGGMRGRWGWDAKCTCGWESRTGGAVRSFVQGLVDDHKSDVHA